MNVSELIAHLEDCDPDAEVRLATQPSWPFEWSISDIIQPLSPQAITKHQFDDATDSQRDAWTRQEEEGTVIFVEEGYEDPPLVVYVAEGRQIGYLPANASSELGWK